MVRLTRFVGIGCIALTVSACTDPLDDFAGPPPGPPPGDNPAPPTFFWPSNGLVFVQGQELRVITAAGTPHRVAAIEGTMAMPAWSHDGTRVAFSAVQTGGQAPWSIRILHSDGRVDHVTPSNHYEMGVSWSPDDERIAFLSRAAPDGEDEIIVMNLRDGSRIHLSETGPGASPGYPAWAPDGKRIAYAITGEPANDVAIYLVPLDGSLTRRIAPDHKGLAGGERPAWSPDGERIAYLTGNLDEVVIVDLDGTERTYLQLSLLARNLTWSPDGRFIAFNDECSPVALSCFGSIGLVDVTNGNAFLVGAGFSPSYIPVATRSP